MTNFVECIVGSGETLIEAPVGDATTLAVLMIGLEENGGRDVQRAHQVLEVPEALRVWTQMADVPNPVSLAEFASDPASVRRNAWPVDLLVSDQPLAETCEDDAWVGAPQIRARTTGWWCCSCGSRPEARLLRNFWSRPRVSAVR